MLGIKIVQQNNVGLVTFLGKYSRQFESGLHFYIPFFERVKTVSLQSQPLALPVQTGITRDNASISIQVTLNYRITNAERYTFGNSNSIQSMAYQVSGTLRDIIGSMDLDEVLNSTDKINTKLMQNIGDLTNTYGVMIERVQIGDLTPSKGVSEAMENQITASKNKQATISEAQGNAEQIRLNTEAQNAAKIATAKADKQQTEIHADAAAYATKVQAEADQYRIEQLQAALAHVDQQYLNAQSIDALKAAGEQGNLIVVPNDSNADYGQLASFSKMLHKQDQ
ncbi:SPFH/Band 7/PHB domain protein [Fructilactobacillus myrtifloralis]|uniref:SPFH/Band 7/PHB domain protein n=1 Tax=Fructilactobacillus myrtifloralis TaxID=2940301 RepID=A0ABY5BTM3_9LACO|nr:SPFH domain-containing protein [Fructilactobacillus myrtifloralis]USS85608.1 SPFH/Band 7/PHB domain protein [Fructilactobacillus myrtifloralis]